MGTSNSLVCHRGALAFVIYRTVLHLRTPRLCSPEPLKKGIMVIHHALNILRTLFPNSGPVGHSIVYVRLHPIARSKFPLPNRGDHLFQRYQN
jgi:hypothetical protein